MNQGEADRNLVGNDLSGEEEVDEEKMERIKQKLKVRPRETKTQMNKRNLKYAALDEQLLSKLNIKDAVKKIIFPCNVLVCGRTWSGKSVLIKNLIEKRNFSNVWLISQTATSTGEYDKLIDKDFQFETIDEDLIDFIYEFQEDNPRSKQLIILDDFIDGPRTLHNIPKLVKLATSGRHKNISLIISTQNLTSIPAAIRKQNLCVFAGKQFMSSAEAFGKDFANNQMNMKELKKRIMDIGGRHDWLMLDAREAEWYVIPQEEINLKKYSAPKRKPVYYSSEEETD